MKRIKSKPEVWVFRMEAAEVSQLKHLVENYPITPAVPAKISQTDTGDASREREQLLEESLAAHRAELRQYTGFLMNAKHLKELKTCWRLTLTHEEREILLQMMNDIRVGCWHALGNPEDLYALNASHTARHYAMVAFIHVAGFFEHHLIDSGMEEG